MHVTAILNPQARYGRAGKLRETISNLLAKNDIDVSLLETEYGGHAEVLAKTACDTADIVVAIGGDGTIHEVANGIIGSRRPATLGILPFGTGNDFVKMLDIPLNLEAAIKILAKGKRKAVDYGTVAYITKRDKHQRFFVNTIGIGFDAEVASRASRFKVLPGFTAYLAALIGTLGRLRFAEASVTLKHSSSEQTLFSGSSLLCSVGNGQCSGGLFFLTPDASIEDGLLDVCAIERMSIPRILWSVPKVLRGAHTGMRTYHAGRAKHVSIVVDAGLPLHTDGEVIASDVHQLDVQIVENGLSVIVP